MTLKKPKTGEITGPQRISYSWGQGQDTLYRDTLRGTYEQYRSIRLDPTIALARRTIVSAIVAGSWNIAADDDVPEEAVDFMRHVMSLRETFLLNCVAYGSIDFGWCGFEKIFVVDENRIKINSLKPLLHDITTILVTNTGNFAGYRQRPANGTELDLAPDKCLHTAFEVEAGNLYGSPLLENVRASYNMWNESNDGARRYDKKVAGTHWIVRYPPGTGIVNGETKDNGDIAALLLAALESSGSLALPTTTAEVLQELANVEVADLYGWHVDLLSDDSKKQASFNESLQYLDKQKVRGLGLPERAILEGQHGTLAESAVQGDWATITFERLDREIVRIVNAQLVNQLIELNFGPELIGKVRLEAAPLVDETIGFYQDIYKEILKTGDSGLDLAGLKDKLNLPQVEENEE